MKKIVFCNFHKNLNKDNFLFMHNNVGVGDDLLLPFVALHKFAEDRGILVATTDCMTVTEADAVVFLDMPNLNNQVFMQAISENKPLYLIVLESRIFRPDNYDIQRLAYFNKIFTYDDSMVDCEKYFKLNYAFDLPKEIDTSVKQKLCVMIAGNKKSSHPQELYSAREQLIRWFESYHPKDFDLYGFGWERDTLSSMKRRHYLNPIKLFKILSNRRFVSYRGSVERKKPVLAKYRFVICYENVLGIPGYITEKIFDAFFAGSVPVYLGADNVHEHIPADCFIDRRNFSDHQELYTFMKGMDDSTYKSYLDRIKTFIGGQGSKEFSINTFVRTINENLFVQL